MHIGEYYDRGRKKSVKWFYWEQISLQELLEIAKREFPDIELNELVITFDIDNDGHSVDAFSILRKK